MVKALEFVYYLVTGNLLSNDSWKEALKGVAAVVCISFTFSAISKYLLTDES